MSSPETHRLENFRKTPVHGDCIFECLECGHERIWGITSVENRHYRPLLICDTCSNGKEKYTLHGFVRIA